MEKFVHRLLTVDIPKRRDLMIQYGLPFNIKPFIIVKCRHKCKNPKVVWRYICDDYTPTLSHDEFCQATLIQRTRTENPRQLCLARTRDIGRNNWCDKVCGTHERSFKRRYALLSAKFGRDISSILMLCIGFQLY
jgi:hypothetical protein